VLTVMFGSLMGFIYVRSAGFEFDEDESEAAASAHRLNTVRQNVASTFGSGPGSDATAPPPSAAANVSEQPDTALLTTAIDEFFDGPLRVVTSTRALFLSAFAGGFAHTFYSNSVRIMCAAGPIA